jgi:hypothetical protein
MTLETPVLIPDSGLTPNASGRSFGSVEHKEFLSPTHRTVQSCANFFHGPIFSYRVSTWHVLTPSAENLKLEALSYLSQ